MKKIIALLICFVMVFSFAACKGTGETSGNDVSQNISEQAPEQGFEQTPEQTLEGEDAKTEVNEYGMPMAADNMLNVLEALLTTDFHTDLEYAIWNEEFIWTACGMLISSGSLEEIQGEIKGDRMYVSADVVKQCVNAMFAGYDANTDALPEVSENVEYDASTNQYGFLVGDYGDQELSVIECKEAGASGISMKVALKSASDGKQFSGTYDVFMNGTTYEGQESIFSYMVTSFAMVEGAPDSKVAAEGDISEGDALGIIEDIYGQDGEVDPDTGNIIGYGYEGITNVDNVNYHNFRMTWLVIDENGEASHSSYLQNVFVSMDGSKILEGYLGSDGWEIVED